MAHGSKPLRGLESTQQSSISTGKFGRMFRWLPPAIDPSNPAEQADVETMLRRLAELMISTEFADRVKNGEPPDQDITEPEPDDENPTIAAGYTYLGQFIDHDTTFDPASSLQKTNDPDALEDFRTPRLDLDCIYGRGPGDQPFLYAKPDRCTFILGQNRGIGTMNRPDLQRTADGTALIGDKRNDENKIVAQIQALFLKFHNKVFADIGALRPSMGTDEHFAVTQRIVRWTYQYLVLHDFLPRICHPGYVEGILPKPNAREPKFEFYRPHDGAYIPVEFSVAAYRFGHSMVRPSYLLNDVARSSAKFNPGGGKPPVDFKRIPIFVVPSTASTDAMNGFGELQPALPPSWGIDWNFFFGEVKKLPDGTKQIPQPSYRIDATLVDPLGMLPEFAGNSTAVSPMKSLAFRNLARGVSMGLPGGQQVARMMNAQKVMTEEQLWHKKAEGDNIKDWPDGKTFYAANKRWLEGHAPLWYYILKEAEILHKGHHLGEVGSRIVAETLIGLVWHDHFSYLFQQPGWTPAAEGIAGLGADITMLKLTQYVG